MNPNSGNHFSEKDHAQNKKLERDDDSKKIDPAQSRKHEPVLNDAFKVLKPGSRYDRYP
jgi:hypothetical protein